MTGASQLHRAMDSGQSVGQAARVMVVGGRVKRRKKEVGVLGMKVGKMAGNFPQGVRSEDEDGVGQLV